MFGLTWKLILSFAATTTIFLLFPQIDLWFSSLFYSQTEGFYLRNHFMVRLAYNGIVVATTIFATLLLGLLVADWILKKELLGIKKKNLAFLLLVLTLGPGVVVNFIFKESWGRARPIQITQFGGDKQFTPPFVKTNQCKKNCSFPSGHAAIGFYYMAVAMLLKRRKMLGWGLALLVGAWVGWARIVQGGHFLSDVIFSFFFVLVIARISYYWFFERGA